MISCTPLSRSSLAKMNTQHPSAELWNAMLKEVGNRLPASIELGGGTGDPFPHPWKATLERWTTPTVAAGQRGVDRLWRLGVIPGFVNDDAAYVPYRAKDDERGWKGVKEAEVNGWVDRPLYAVDDPPFMLLTAPKADERDSEQWVTVPLGARLPYFAQEEFKESTVFMAVVSCAASPAVMRIIDVHAPAPKLKRFRMVAGRRLQPVVAQAGGAIELAQLFLVRAKGGEPKDDVAYVKQLVFWNLGTLVNQPHLDLPPQEPPPSFGGLGLGLADGFAAGLGLVETLQRDELDRLYEDAASVLWWSQ